MSRTKRNHINYKTGKREKIRDNKPRCQCCCNPRHSAHGNKKEKLTMQERKEKHDQSIFHRQVPDQMKRRAFLVACMTKL